MRRAFNLLADPPTAEPTGAPAEPSPSGGYLELYGLSKPPFGKAVNAANYILFNAHRRAFELLADHMLNGSGIMLLSGEAGAGKTQMMRALGDVAEQSDLRVIRVFRPPNGRISRYDLVAALGRGTNAAHEAVLIDDVDLLPPECLTELPAIMQRRVNASWVFGVSTGTRRPDLAQVLSGARNTVRIVPLSPAEVRQYIERSLWVAGGATRRLIAPDAMRAIVSRAGGTPGSINSLMEAVLTAGFVRNDPMITARTVSAVTGAIVAKRRLAETTIGLRLFPLAGLLLFVTGASTFLYRGVSGMRHAPAAAAQQTTQAADNLPTGQPAVASAPLPDNQIVTLIKIGNDLLGQGDVTTARAFFQRAVQAGSAAAAVALGQTYDPALVPPGSRPDPGLAANWYQRAVGLGDPGASDLLKKLSRR